MTKPRSDSKLLNLPEEQQAQLAEWLLAGTPYHEAVKLVAKEFGVSCSLSALSRFFADVCSPHLIRRRRQAASTAEEVAQEASRSPAQFDAATIDALQQKAFELAISPMSSPKDIKALFALLQKSTDQRIRQEQLKLDREKFQFDAAKAALEKLPELQAIARTPNLDDRARIDQIRAALFGQLPAEAARS